MRYLILASLVFATACGGDDDDDDNDTAIDATAGTIDATANAPDAPASTIDADLAFDAAGPDADGCGTIGKACTLDGNDCDDGQRCEFSTGGNFCTKMRDGCGGFAGATCDDPAAPLCHYLPGADTGPCLSAFERDCICERSPGSILDCP